MRQVNKDQMAVWRRVEDNDLAPLTKKDYQAHVRRLKQERDWRLVRDDIRWRQLAKWREDQLEDKMVMVPPGEPVPPRLIGPTGCSWFRASRSHGALFQIDDTYEDPEDISP